MLPVAIAMNRANPALPRGIRAILAAAMLWSLAACTGFDGARLLPGTATIEDVERDMGQPALRWLDPDGSQQLAYPRGPSGFETFMVRIDRDGRLVSIANVLTRSGFAAVEAGMSQDEVLRLLGPSNSWKTVYFAARDELVWDWRFCDELNQPARFYVLFDGSTGKVRSTLRQAEALGSEQFDLHRFCGHPPRHAR